MTACPECGRDCTCDQYKRPEGLAARWGSRYKEGSCNFCNRDSDEVLVLTSVSLTGGGLIARICPLCLPALTPFVKAPKTTDDTHLRKRNTPQGPKVR